MFETLRNAWKVVDLRKKILFTLLIIVVFRIGSVIPVPFIDTHALHASSSAVNEFLNILSTLGGGALTYGTVFALGVTPYINSSIIMQLLSVAIPALERLSKEGEEGRRKIAKYTRIATVGLAILQGIGYFFYLKNSDFLTVKGVGMSIFAGFVIVACLAAGSALVMWLGEQIDAKGIGNGISMLLFTGIIAQAPTAATNLYLNYWETGRYGVFIAILAAFLLVIAFIVWMTDAERRIPVQYAKKVVGRKMYGGQNTHIPIKVNMSGVMPIIFASSILMVPTMILSFMGDNTESFWFKLLSMFSTQGVFYALLYFAMIIAFAYFYVTIQYNPVEMANNLRQNSGAIPGIRPGTPTSDFIQKILSRVTLLGALFLSVIAVLPILVSIAANINISLGGTSVLILVGVALETVKNLESQMLMRHYKGFLE